MNSPTLLADITSYCDDKLRIWDYHDYSLNGLQYEGSRPVTKVCLAVDATLEAVIAAKEMDAQLLLVHHGLFWGKAPIPLRGRVGQIVRELVKSDISLLAYHLPLDAHDSLGNNTQLAKQLGLTHCCRFANEGRLSMGVTGFLASPQSITDLAVKIGQLLDSTARFHNYGAEVIDKIAICSGRGVSEEWMIEAQNLGCKAYLTGEVVYEELLAAQHLGMNIICAGHYQTEKLGVKALGEELAKKFGLTCQFAELPGSLKAW